MRPECALKSVIDYTFKSGIAAPRHVNYRERTAPDMIVVTIKIVTMRNKATSSLYAATTLWLFISCVVFYTACTRGHFWSTDEVAVYQQARSLWEHGDLSIAPINNTLPGRGG